MKNQFEEFKAQARALPLAELKKHALVSSRHRCRCNQCFCCAALAVLNEIKIVLGRKEIDKKMYFTK